MEAMISFIVTCKDRLEHLKQTLPLMIQQSFSEVIVVDYGCSQGTEQWVTESYPTARVIKVSDDPEFCLARARNFGAAGARSDFVCFIDADSILKIDLGLWFEKHARSGHYFRSPDRVDNFQLNGFLICEKKVFHQIGGYDEAHRGWGGEDKDIHERLEMSGLEIIDIPQNSLTCINHSDNLRQLGNKGATDYLTRPQALALNNAYRLLKFDIQALMRNSLSLDERIKLRKNIINANIDSVAAGRETTVVRITLPIDPYRNQLAKAERSLVYMFPTAQ